MASQWLQPAQGGGSRAGAEPAGMRLTPSDGWLVAVLWIALCVWTAAATAAANHHAVPSMLMTLFIAALAALSQASGLRVRVSGQPPVDAGAAAVLVGFVLLGPAWAVTVAAPAVLGLQLLLRRPWVHALHDAAVLTIGSGAAFGVVLVMEHPDWSSARGTVVAASVLLAVRLAQRICAAGLARVTEGAGLRALLRRGWRLELVVLLGNALLAGGLLLVAQDRADTAAALSLVAVFSTARIFVVAHDHRRMSSALERIVTQLSQLEEQDVMEAALSGAVSLFHADGGSIQLMGDQRRPPRRYELGADGSAVCRTGSCAPPETGAGADVVVVLRGPLGDVGRLWLRYPRRAGLTAYEMRVLRGFGQTLSMAVVATALYEDARVDLARQSHEASHDPLTGLANRARLREHIGIALEARHDLTTALLLVDLDHFKEINDTLGHVAGDVLLRRVADRLSSFSRPGDLVARLGGDEFAVLLTGLESAADARPAADELVRLLADPVSYEGMRLSVEGSVGLACYPADAADADELLRRAEVAMYQAKADRGSWVRYEPRHDGTSVDRLALVAELRSALEREEIVVHFQPQADLHTGSIVGVEALARWEHPVRGLLQPADFVGVAEQSGLVRPFTLRVLDLAVAECARWTDEGASATVAVNLAARSLLDRQLPHDVAAALARHGLPPDRLVLEITESTATSELEVVEEVLGRLRRLGVELSVDDFGTGYSSLAFLQRTAVHELKVDRSFVTRMRSSDSDQALVRATVELAHSLGARAVAEGVEDAAVAEALRSVGCDVGQGYWLSRPVPADQLRTLLGLGEPIAEGAVVPRPRPEQTPIARLRAVDS